MSFRHYRAYFLVPLFYIAVIFGLLFLQFARRSEKFFDSVMDLVLTGATSQEDKKGGGEKKIEDIRLRYKGIAFSFGERQEARLVYKGGSDYKLNPVSYRKTETGFNLAFDRNVSLSFTLDSPKELLSIQAAIGKQAAGEVQELVMGFSAVEGAALNSVERMPVLSVGHGKKNYLLSLPERSSIDMARQLLVVVPTGGSALLSFGPPAEDTEESFRQWYANSMGNASSSAAALALKVNEYLDGAYQGWKTGRYSAEYGNWLNEENVRNFRESLVAAYLAEALKRGEYAAVREQTREAASRHASSLTFLTSPFFGNIQELSSRLFLDDAKESSRILALVRNNDSSVWARQDLLRFAGMRGSAGLKSEILKFAESLNLQTVSLPAALGMLLNYYAARQDDPDSVSSLRRFADLVNSKILPAIRKIRDGFFLESDPGKIDIYLSILAGRVCMSAGEADKDPVLESIGRDLVISVLNLADRQGFLPKNILVAESALQGTEGRIAPENVYTLIANDSPYYPRFIDLTRRLGPGAWLYTAANITSLNLTPERYTIRFQFVPGETHHFLLCGVKQYSEIQLWRIPWRIDLNFERYNIGAYYIPQQKLFMAKYNHRNRDEEFSMSFVPAAAPAEGAGIRPETAPTGSSPATE
jgi:hypothetical protein